MENSTLVQQFIEQVWNNRAFEKMPAFLHPEFKDYSLPPALFNQEDGTMQWIINTGLSFEHWSIIDEQVTEGDKSVVKITMQLKHIGVWRDIEPTGLELQVTGYRLFHMKEGKIVAHWALLDGQTIENQLKEMTHGCKIVR